VTRDDGGYDKYSDARARHLFTKRDAFPCGVSRQQTSAARLQGTAALPAVPPGGLGADATNKPGRKSCRFIGYDCTTPCLL